MNNCSDSYVSESTRRISERIIDHSGREQNWHVFKHRYIKNHPNTNKTYFKIISSGFKNNCCRQKNCRNNFKKTNQTIFESSRVVL